jgi:hypothetical protein
MVNYKAILSGSDIHSVNYYFIAKNDNEAKKLANKRFGDGFHHHDLYLYKNDELLAYKKLINKRFRNIK